MITWKESFVPHDKFFLWIIAKVALATDAVDSRKDGKSSMM
jgi:hypothetical protein